MDDAFANMWHEIRMKLISIIGVWTGMHHHGNTLQWKNQYLEIAQKIKPNVDVESLTYPVSTFDHQVARKIQHDVRRE